MIFVYSYKTSDGQRHEGEIEAADREAAFAALREQGIRAMRVEPKGWKTGVGRTVGLKRWIFGLVAFMAVGACVGLYFGRRAASAQPSGGQDVALKDGERIARPQPRRQLHGRIERFDGIFGHPSEAFLALYAEPGKKVDRIFFSDEVLEDFEAALQDVIIIEEGDPVPVCELKRIVAGMKEELALYLKGGKGIRDYANYLGSRQTMEAGFRDSLQRQVDSGEVGRDEANDRLAAMGFEKLGGERGVAQTGEKN